MLHEKESFIAAHQQCIVQQTPQRGFPEIMSVFVTVLWQPYFGHNDMKAGLRLNRLEEVRIV
jgi:hypothetical protein